MESEIKFLILSQRFMVSEEFAIRMNIRLKRQKAPRSMLKQNVKPGAMNRVGGKEISFRIDI
jgi:hypothetical protein